MTKFTFDAIGRDLFPAEKAAAKVFIRSYATPQDGEEVKRQMRIVKSRVAKAVVEGKSFTTAFYDQVKRAGQTGKTAATNSRVGSSEPPSRAKKRKV